jgi:hypothetical protein
VQPTGVEDSGPRDCQAHTLLAADKARMDRPATPGSGGRRADGRSDAVIHNSLHKALSDVLLRTAMAPDASSPLVNSPNAEMMALLGKQCDKHDNSSQAPLHCAALWETRVLQASPLRSYRVWQTRRRPDGPAGSPAIDLRQAPHVARAIAVAALGRDPGPMATADSISHHVYVGSDIVVKVIDTAGHSRLDREIALAACLPTGLTAPERAFGLPGRHHA